MSETELPTINSMYDNKTDQEYAIEDTAARKRVAALEGNYSTVIISTEEVNPAEEHGGTWTYHEGMHLFAGLKIYTKDNA